MNHLRDLILFCQLFQIGFRWCLGHNDGTMGDIGFKCPIGSMFYQGYCFRKETVPMTWKHAETACLRSGMYLAWLEDDIENEYVATHVMSDVNQYWIGLSNTSSKAGENEVSWSRYRMSEDKTIPVYKGLWKNLQPADFIEENKCVSTLKDKYDNHWTVTNCRKKLPFVCKLMGAPKPHDIIFCGNGGYIHKKWKCDGQNDCGDMSDEIDCSASCSELILLEKDKTGAITMTSFDNNAFCTWTIQAPVGARIKITISSNFHLEENADVLSVWTGGISLKESNFLGRVTGSLQSQKEFYSQNNYIIMQLSMDGSINVRSGFTVTYETVEDAVIWNDLRKLTATTSWQNLDSPLYGTAVPFGLQLEWFITAESYQVVTLEFLDVDFPTSSSLQVYDGEDLMAPQVFLLNKTPLHPIYISRSKSIRIVLSTDQHEYTKYRGFRLKYKKGCNFEMKQQGTIYSPGYKVGNYPSNVTCAWILTRNTGETKPISLRFTEFKLKSNSDYVEVYNDTAGTALHMGGGLTGTSDIIEIFSSTYGYLNVTFRSNLVLVEKGFNAEFSVDCPMLTLSQWTINSVSDKYTAFNTELELSCQSGYSFKQEEYNRASSVALKCLPGGKWNVSRIPDCQITYCGTHPAIQNGILISATGTKVGDYATYKCNGGFTLWGSTTIRCRENGNWETLPTCYAQQCSPISDPINGNVNVTEGRGTDFASVLMFSCDPGYDLLGSVYIHCRSNGTWSHPKPSCTEIKCPIPQVMYGKVESGGDVKYKETARLKCDAGFILNGTTLTEKDVTCGSDAMFSGLDPCVNNDECSLSILPTCTSSLNTKCVDTVGSYICKCKDGFSRISSLGSCVDIDECSVNNGGCSHSCTNDPGSYSCSCNPGYALYVYPDFNNISLAVGETGTREGDTIRINHTCVRVQCPKPVSLFNGNILSNKKHFYYEDQIDIECDHGYFLEPNTHTLKCKHHGQWSADMPNCKKGSCITPYLSADPNYNRIFPNENTNVDFGTDVTIECRYGTRFRNLSLYCGENHLATYELLGDNLTCPVIDCGLPEHVPGAENYIYANTLYGSSFNFVCKTYSVRSGFSVNGDYTVICRENGRWGFGNLACTVGRCTDPGTPGGAVQVVRSYEAGELLRFRCLREGYEPVPAAPLLCQQLGVNNATWNSTKIPICTDVTPPKFLNCHTFPFYVDKMEATNFSVPTAMDNSGLVKNVTVMPYNFKPGTVVSKDVNVTYTAVDNSGNSETCTISFIIKDRTQARLICITFIKKTINTTTGFTVDLKYYVSTGATFYPNQFITLNPSTLDGPRQVKATLQDKWGTLNTCTFLIYTKAEVCFKESLPLVSNAARSCVSVGGNYTCTYNCKAGYVYYDGTTSKQYHCSGANNWSPSAIPEDCLMYETPSYEAKLEIHYVTTDTLASNCIAGFEKMLALYNTTIAQSIYEKCSDLAPGRFVITSLSITAYSFKIVAVIKGKFIGDGMKSARDTCINFITIISPSFILPVLSITCAGDQQAAFTVEKIDSSEAGNNCIDNMVLVNSQYCVNCPPGSFFNKRFCTKCPDEHYQDLAGQLSCKSCSGNTVSNDDRTICIAKCPPGFTSEDGMTNCRPCGRNKFWVNATNCEDCPAGFITDVMNGVPDIEGCKAPCPAGMYSLTGHEPCEKCPLHYYQDAVAQTTCKECGEKEKTESVDRNSSSSCIAIASTECNNLIWSGCNNGKCAIQNHEAVCVCNEGYSGASCEALIDVCQSSPCFNGGLCVQNEHRFNCTCPSSKDCELQKLSGSYVVEDQDIERATKKSVEDCERECLNDEKCRAIFYVNGFCFIVYKDVPPKPYTGTALYYDKVCTNMYSGPQCETDLINECTPDTCSAQGMCQDRAEKDPVCLCPIVGEYSQPKCDMIQNLCNPNPCQNGAECKSWGAVRRQCICRPDYTGVNCSVNIDECGSNRYGCMYNGICLDGVDSYICDCVPGFSGRHCQVIKDLCSGTPCSNGGCVNNYANATYKCFCDYPYQLGSNGQCEMMDLCNTTNCNNGTCLNGNCSCVDGYEGSLCQHSVDDCKTKPCKNGGTCVDGHKDYSCECPSGFTGKVCEMNLNDCPGSCNLTYTKLIIDKIAECECICVNGYTGIDCTEELDECASVPCKHGASCTDRVNDYHCNCTEGWTGKNCDKQIDYCSTTTNKCQSGKCFNLIDDKYCRCRAGTRGDTCEDIPDVCNVINPCTSMGSCGNSNGTAECSCQINYSGKSCQLLKDFCTGSTTCLYMGMPGTGGMCTNRESGGYNCQCQTGYYGATCQTKATLCSTLNCGSNAQCNEEIGCYCPEGKILTDGKTCKQPSNDFDMLFDPQIGDGGAYTIAVLNDPDNSDLSFMLWVRFNKDQKDIENTVILKLGEFAEVKNDSITVWNTTNNFVVDFKIVGSRIEMDDGKWHFIVCSWKRNGESLVAVDGVKVFEDMSLPGTLPKVLRIEIGKKFGGRISQVKLWANSLTVSDVYKLDENKDYVPPGSTVVHGWYNYRMNKGANKKVPTQIEREVCDVPACSSSDKLKPTIKACASDTSLTSVKRVFSHTLPKFIDMFEDFNESLSLTSHSGDNTFTWGTYSLLFMASDNNGNTALCQFKLYVRYNKECPATRTFSSINYCSVSSNDICKLDCPSNQQLSVPAPKYIPCSKLGVYNPLKPQEKIVLPSCGDKSSTTIQIDVSLEYSLQVTCSETYEAVMESKLMTNFMHDVFNAWDTVCSTSACENVQISSFCVPASKQIKVALKIRNLKNSIIKKAVGSVIYTPTEVLKILIFDEDAFNAEDIGGAKVLENQVVITDTLSCPDGFMLIGKTCIACSMGTFYNSTSQNCEFCPVGTYGSTTGLRKCTICGSGKTTLGVGYTARSDCVDDCPVGEFWNVTECSLCAKHFYQSVTGKDYCFPCPLGKLTTGQGSNSSTQCYSDCPEGTELQLDGKCVKCPRGYYRSFLEDVCMECPAGITTVGDGSTNADHCYLTKCYKGTYRNRSTNVCEPCPVGQYQPKDLQEECIKCPTKYTTESDGKNNITDCKFYCSKGYEILSAASETCQPCPRGFFKDNSIVFSNCFACPSGLTTEKINSTSIDSCSIRECSSGQEIDSTGGCSDCELNTYQPVNMPTSTDKCLSCKDNHGTKQKMSNNSSDCLRMCLEGHFFHQTSMMCEKCPKGRWNNGNSTMKFEGCVNCPVNFTTTGPGMISEDNCTILDCDPGSYISGTDCLLCDYGYYQPARHQESCIKCGTNLNTSTEGASTQEECQLYCGAGLEGRDSCTACMEGFVKSWSGTGRCHECTGNLTSNVARTACTELFCDKGFYSNAHQTSCMPCDIGYFKKDRGNALACTRCPDGFLTPNIASTSAKICNEPFCIPGQYLDSSGVCVPCMIGFYKEVTGNGKCTACPSNLTTPLTGSTALSNCSIVVCDAGEKRISSNNTCMKCPLGYYQPERGESECIKCGDGQTTEQVGTDTKTGCIPICPAGKEYVFASKTCRECPLGSYKSEIGNNKSCTTCPSGYTTEFTGSISANNCSHPDCLPGTYRSTGGCQNCPEGTYQDQNSQESCKNCPLDRNTTETTGATSENFCIKLCLAGQQYFRTSGTCKNCPKDFYTNRTISQYCIKCPTGYITYGEGSPTCIPLSAPDTGITQAPLVPVQKTYTFILKYKATVDCYNVEIRNQIAANILVTIRAHLRELVKRFSKLCILQEIRNCFASIEVLIKECHRIALRKRATGPSAIDVELNIPDLGETVTDNTKYVELQTEIMLQEDLDTRKTEYSPAGLSLLYSIFTGKFVSCVAGYISTNNNQSCEICPAGTYHDGTNNRCMNCAQNSYQDQTGKTSCKNCPETINKYIPFTGSKSESDCISFANDTSNVTPVNLFHYYYIGVGSAIFVLVVVISVIFGRVFCRRKAKKPKRYYYENPLTTRVRPEDGYTGLSNSGEYATINEMRENMNMRTYRESTPPSDIYLTPRGHPN